MRNTEQAARFGVYRSWAPFVSGGWVGVQIFFVISGFVIAYTAHGRGPLPYLASRFLRLAPGLWICATLSVPALLLAGSPPHEVLELFVRSLLLFPLGPWVASSYWTLPLEVFFYALILILLWRGRFGRVGVLAAILALLGLAWWLWAVSAPMLPAPGARAIAWLTDRKITKLLLIQHGCFFAIGLLGWLLHHHGWTRARAGWLGVAIVAGMLEIWSEAGRARAWSGIENSAWLPLCLFAAALATIAVTIPGRAAAIRCAQPWARAIRGLGLATYPLYLLHQPLGLPVLLWQLRNGVPAAVALVRTALAVLAASLLVALRLEPAVRRALIPVLQRRPATRTLRDPLASDRAL